MNSNSVWQNASDTLEYVLPAFKHSDLPPLKIPNSLFTTTVTDMAPVRYPSSQAASVKNSYSMTGSDARASTKTPGSAESVYSQTSGALELRTTVFRNQSNSIPQVHEEDATIHRGDTIIVSKLLKERARSSGRSELFNTHIERIERDGSIRSIRTIPTRKSSASTNLMNIAEDTPPPTPCLYAPRPIRPFSVPSAGAWLKRRPRTKKRQMEPTSPVAEARRRRLRYST